MAMIEGIRQASKWNKARGGASQALYGHTSTWQMEKKKGGKQQA